MKLRLESPTRELAQGLAQGLELGQGLELVQGLVSC